MAQDKAKKALFQSQTEIVISLAVGRLNQLAVYRFDKARKAVGPVGLVRHDAEFRSFDGAPSPAKSWFERLFQPKKTDDLINAYPELATAAIHARDGHLRQKAVMALVQPENDPLDLAALLCRCNDPVSEVQQVAIKRWKEICQMPKVNALAEILPILLDRTPHWQRGGFAALNSVEQRPDYRRLLETMFLNSTTGSLAKRLRFALRTPQLDDAVGVLAVCARSAFIRAIATQVVLEGATRRQIGCTWQWVDKTISLRRRIPEWDVRQVTIDPTLRQKVLCAALRDKSVGVRKLGLDYLTGVGPEGFEKELAELRLDPKNAIKWRMDYFDRKWSGENSVEMT